MYDEKCLCLESRDSYFGDECNGCIDNNKWDC
jgi:hypothetical protein